MGGGGVQGWFFSGCSGVIWRVVLSGRSVWRCSGLFGFVQGCSGLFGVDSGARCQLLSTFVNLCHGLVTVGQAVVAGGERHEAALLFWCEVSRGWENWGCVVGDRGVGERWWTCGASHPPPNLPPSRGEVRWGRRCSGLVFFWVFGGDLAGGPIWSGCLAVFGFVRGCSGLFGVDSGARCQLLSTFVTVWSPLVRLGLLGGERHEVALLFWCEVSRGWENWGVWWVIGVLESVGGHAGPPTPHLTSPLEGGRDELGEAE